MNVFFSDIDNTLIFSHRKKLGENDVVVEYLNGKEQSFMTANLYKLLVDHRALDVVPVTTRTIEQYRRLFVFEQELKSEYALVCNGGILLKNGVVDEDWRAETLNISREQNSEVRRLLEYVKKRNLSIKIIPVDDFMFYTVFDASVITEMFCELRNQADLNMVSIEKDARKIYVIANNVNKGLAIQRFKNEHRYTNCIVAGDSNFDISMLDVANKAIASRCLIGMLNNNNIVYSQEEILAYDIDMLLNKELEVLEK